MSELAVLQLEIRDNADKAASGLEALATSLGNIKNALSGGLKLTTTANQVKKFNDTVNTIGTGQTVGKLNALATIMNKIADAVERLDKSSVTLKRTMQAINSFNRPMGLPGGTGASRPAPTVETASIQEAKSELAQAQEVAGNIHLNQGEITQEAEAVSDRIRNLTERLSTMREALARIRENGGTNTALTATANAITHLVGELSSLGVSTRAMNQATQEAEAARNAVDGLASSSEKAAASTTAVRDACSETTDKLKEMQFQLAVDEALLKKFESEGADSGKIAAQKTIIAAQKAAIARMGSGAAELKGTSEAAADLGTKMETVATSAEKAAEAVNAKPSGNTWMDKVLDLVNTSSEIDRVRNKIEALQNTLAQDLKAGGMSQTDIDKRVAEIQKYIAKEEKLVAARGPLYKPETGMSAEDKAAVTSAPAAMRDYIKANEIPTAPAVESKANVARLSEEYIQGKHHIDAMKESLMNLKAQMSQGLRTGSLSTSEADKLGASIRKLEEDYKKATSAAEKFRDAVGRIKNGVNGLKNAFFSANGGLLSFLKGMARMARYRMFRAIIREITEGITTGLKNYREYSKLIGGSYASDMQNLDNSLLKMKNSIGAALAPALQALLPLINSLTKGFINLVNYMNQFFSLMRGQKTWSMATDVVANTGDAMEQTGNQAQGAANKINHLLASWDELNIIESKSGGGGGGAGSGVTDNAQETLNMFKEMEEFDVRVRDLVGFLEEHVPLVEATIGALVAHFLGLNGSTVSIVFGLIGSYESGKKHGLLGDSYAEALADIDLWISTLAAATGGAWAGFKIGGPKGAFVGAIIGVIISLLASYVGWTAGERQRIIDEAWGDIELTDEEINDVMTGKFFRYDVKMYIDIVGSQVNHLSQQAAGAYAKIQLTLGRYKALVAVGIKNATPEDLQKLQQDVNAVVSDLNGLIDTQKVIVGMALSNEIEYTVDNKGMFTRLDANLTGVDKYITGIGNQIGKILSDGVVDKFEEDTLEGLMNALNNVGQAITFGQTVGEKTAKVNEAYEAFVNGDLSKESFEQMVQTHDQIEQELRQAAEKDATALSSTYYSVYTAMVAANKDNPNTFTQEQIDQAYKDWLDFSTDGYKEYIEQRFAEYTKDFEPVWNAAYEKALKAILAGKGPKKAISFDDAFAEYTFGEWMDQEPTGVGKYLPDWMNNTAAWVYKLVANGTDLNDSSELIAQTFFDDILAGIEEGSITEEDMTDISKMFEDFALMWYSSNLGYNTSELQSIVERTGKSVFELMNDTDKLALWAQLTGSDNEIAEQDMKALFSFLYQVNPDMFGSIAEPVMGGSWSPSTPVQPISKSVRDDPFSTSYGVLNSTKRTYDDYVTEDAIEYSRADVVDMLMVLGKMYDSLPDWAVKWYESGFTDLEGVSEEDIYELNSMFPDDIRGDIFEKLLLGEGESHDLLAKYITQYLQTNGWPVEGMSVDSATVEATAADVTIGNANLNLNNESAEVDADNWTSDAFGNTQDNNFSMLEQWVNSGFSKQMYYEWDGANSLGTFDQELEQLREMDPELAEWFDRILVDYEKNVQRGLEDDIFDAMYHLQEHYLPYMGMPDVNNSGAGGSGGGGGGNGDGAGQKLDTTNNHLDAMERSLKNLEKGFQIRPSLALYNAVRESERMFGGLHG